MKFLNPKKQSRVMRWGALAAFFYIIFRTFSGSPSVTVPNMQTAAKTEDCPGKAEALKDQIGWFAIPLFPTIMPELNVQDLETGTGDTAHCGQHVDIRYSYASKSGTEIFSNIGTKTSTQAALGDGTLLRGLELGLEGMQVGGVRRLTFSPAYGFRSLEQMSKLKDHDHFAWKEEKPLGNQEIVATATLLGVTPPTPVSAMPARIINTKLGSGEEAFCGNAVTVHITVWSVAGEELFSTRKAQPLTVMLGSSGLPYGIEQAILGMRAGTDRILILPPALQLPLESGKPNALASLQTPSLVPLAGKETVLVEISLLSGVQPSVLPQK